MAAKTDRCSECGNMVTTTTYVRPNNPGESPVWEFFCKQCRNKWKLTAQK